jgi:hypothetical protein
MIWLYSFSGEVKYGELERLWVYKKGVQKKA